MKKVILGLLILILAIAGYYWYKFSRGGNRDSGPKQQPIALKKHSDSFNLAVSNAMTAYFDMATAFVEADTAKAKEQDRKFIQLLDSIPMDELKKDTASIYDIAMNSLSSIQANAESILTMTDILEMRKDFSMVSANLYPDFFKIINYEGEKMYWLNCPMAFGDDKEANWISKTKDVINPYLGKYHSQYKATMLHCGMVKDTIKAQ
ncbi:MAG: DUF3347 domain-containing protein [Ferruginibacter sp.]